MIKAALNFVRKTGTAFFFCLFLTNNILADYQIQISIDSKGESAQTAKEKGIALGRKKAFETLLKRLLPNSEFDRLISAPPNSEDFLVTYHLAQERFSPTHYKADISYQFDTKALQQYFQSKRLSYLDAMIPRFVILPLIRQNGQLKFYWQALDLLREIEERYPLLDFLLPLGDLDDDKLFDDQAQTAQTLFANLNNRYGLNATLILILDVSDAVRSKEEESDAPTANQLLLNKVVIKPFGLVDFDSFVYQLKAPDVLSVETLKHHFEKIFPILIGNWFDKHLVRVFEPKPYLYKINTYGLKSMTKTLDWLENLAQTDQVNLKEFNTENMIVEIIYRGEQDKLEQALNSQKILYKSLNSVSEQAV
ncbi:MAG: hypothetical protein CMM87_00550 [Rickettsiales bacterium]|nr:hypothetical protein [Rickettsiales bacterium]|tara:strand:+ start:77640 stop:78734 length:1095 start_codon:yes stop_codon:yes gene_type:complete